LNGRFEPRDRALRPNPAIGPNGRPGRPEGFDRNDRFGRNNRNEGFGRNGGVAATNPIGPAGSAIVTPSGGGSATGGAVTPRGGAVQPVVPGLDRDSHGGDRGRQFDHRVIQPSGDHGGQIISRPPVSTTPSAPAIVTPHEPMRRFDPPSQRGSSPSMGERNSPPAMAPMPRSTPPPAAAPMPRSTPPASIPQRGMEPRSPQAFRGSSPAMQSPSMRGGGGMSRGASAPAMHGGGGGHSMGGGGHSMGGGSQGGHGGGRRSVSLLIAGDYFTNIPA
jgi:hypothetical protein